MDVLQTTLNEYDKLFGSNLENSSMSHKSPNKKSSCFGCLRTPYRWPVWTWWFAIMIPMLIALYFGTRDSLRHLNLLKLDKDIDRLNISTAQEILALKQKLETHEAKYLEDVRNLIRQYIQKYDADKTGMPDYALESSGAFIISTRNTVPYKEPSKRASIWGIPLYYTNVNPRSVIQRKSQGINAGECWPFVGGHGYLTIKLSHRVNVTAISYEHLPKELAPSGELKSAPNEFIVWSYQDANDLSTRFELGRFVYDINGDSLQMFTVNNHDVQGTPVVELEIVSNYGDQKTCLYRFRVHGIPLEEGE
uniref:SUN domain-containing protein n=1 Tax=Acrobeloides nanus TaxID=290746 RepID=A0A914DYN0_9BILA